MPQKKSEVALETENVVVPAEVMPPEHARTGITIEINQRLNRAKVIVVVAGMEGALPSVIGGLVEQPVVAVPTSVGYGASFNGLAALLGMLNTCASGVTVVNIDNGFGAGYFAHLICRG